MNWEFSTLDSHYKVTGKYLIDSNFLGPTELRLIISGMIILEVIFPGSIAYLTLIATVVLLFDCYRETVRLLELADVRDKNEKKAAWRKMQIVSVKRPFRVEVKKKNSWNRLIFRSFLFLIYWKSDPPGIPENQKPFWFSAVWVSCILHIPRLIPCILCNVLH